MALSLVYISFYPPPAANTETGGHPSGARTTARRGGCDSCCNLTLQSCDPIRILVRKIRVTWFYSILYPALDRDFSPFPVLPPPRQTHLLPRQKITSRSQVIPRVYQRTPDMYTPGCAHSCQPKTFFIRSRVESRENVTPACLVTFTFVYLKKDICTLF